MSYELAPSPVELIRDKRAKAESALGCFSTIPRNSSPTPKDLYLWAEDILGQIASRCDSNPKLSLAKALDILDDPRWRERVGALRATPCHRVIARFARERLWEEIWSLNWDCIQEDALITVGIKRDAPNARVSWPTSFSTFISIEDCRDMGDSSVVRIIKPHGCVIALEQADAIKDLDPIGSAARSDRFLISSSELDQISAEGDPTHYGVWQGRQRLSKDRGLRPRKLVTAPS